MAQGPSGRAKGWIDRSIDTGIDTDSHTLKYITLLLLSPPVHPGATLDMRFVMMIRPGGRGLDDGRLRLIVGGMAFVRLGGTFRGSG